MWAGNWTGWKKNSAMKEADAENKSRKAAALSGNGTPREVFEQEKYETIHRKWKSAGFVLCDAPTMAVPDLFDPKIMVTLEPDSSWIRDYSLTGIDADGWTYAKDFNYLNKYGAGSDKPSWNAYVRRRKWKYLDKSGTNSTIRDVKERQNQRVQSTNKAANASAQASKIGYVSRSRQTELQESDYSSSFGDKDEEMDEESRAGLDRLRSNEREIDSGVEQIANSLDNLMSMAGAMKDTTAEQTKKLDLLDQNMDKAQSKQAVVNARAKRLLR
jgi:hypothetical protein